MHLKALNLYDNGVFFSHYSLATSTTNWVKMFTGLFYAMIWFRDLRIRFQALESTQLRVTTGPGVFASIIISQLRRPIEFNFHTFVMLCMLRYTEWEAWSLTITKGFQGLYNKHNNISSVVVAVNKDDFIKTSFKLNCCIDQSRRAPGTQVLSTARHCWGVHVA